MRAGSVGGGLDGAGETLTAAKFMSLAGVGCYASGASLLLGVALSVYHRI